MREASMALRIRSIAARSRQGVERAQQRLAISLKSEVRFDSIVYDSDKREFVCFYYIEEPLLKQVTRANTEE